MPLKIDNNSELLEARASLFGGDLPSAWLLLNYVGDSTVHLAAGNDSDAESLEYHLKDDEVQYALLRLSTASGVRDVFVSWVGPGVGIVEKGKRLAFVSDAQALLRPYQSSITASSRSRFTTANVLAASEPGGSGTIS